MFEEIVRDLSWRYAEAVDNACMFALFDGYPWDDLTIVDYQGPDMRKVLYYDPFHEIIDAPIGSRPDYNQLKVLFEAKINMPGYER